MTMKNVVAGVAAGALVMASITASAGVAGSKHDLSGKGYGTDQICIFCHTPHNAKTPQLIPLWNHATTATALFTLYSSPTLNAVPGQPTGTSLACLSCHDGTVAVDAYGSSAGNASTKITGDASFGTDLSNDHPISFLYNSALATADGGLVAPGTNTVGALPLFSQSLECATCHDVHDNTHSPFLRMSNSGSAMCLNCHQK